MRKIDDIISINKHENKHHFPLRSKQIVLPSKA